MSAKSAPSPLEGEGRGGGPRQRSSMAQRLRREAPFTERKLWKRLRRDALAGLHFRRQQPIGRYVVDFYCSAVRLVLELDGPSHDDLIAAEKDAIRTRWLNERGYRVLRFSNEEVQADIERVLGIIAMVARPPSLALPLEGGGKRIEGDVG